MSISLNDHEDRISELEKTSAKLQFNTVYNSPTGIRLPHTNDANTATWVTLIDYDPNVDFYMIETCTHTRKRDGITISSQQKIISTFGLSYDPSTKKSGIFVEVFSHGHSDSGDGEEVCYIGVHDNKLKAVSSDTYGGDGNWVRKIITLKLYYSFSYNIIYKAMHLLEKIFYVLNKGGVSL